MMDPSTVYGLTYYVGICIWLVSISASIMFQIKYQKTSYSLFYLAFGFSILVASTTTAKLWLPFGDYELSMLQLIAFFIFLCMELLTIVEAIRLEHSIKQARIAQFDD